LTAWSSCSGPWWSAAGELAVALSSKPRLTELERLAGPSASCCTTPQTVSNVARAPHGVQGEVDVRARLAAHGSVDLGGAAFAIRLAL
jgi:hypothetical protein